MKKGSAAIGGIALVFLSLGTLAVVGNALNEGFLDLSPSQTSPFEFGVPANDTWLDFNQSTTNIEFVDSNKAIQMKNDSAGDSGTYLSKEFQNPDTDTTRIQSVEYETDIDADANAELEVQTSDDFDDGVTGSTKFKMRDGAHRRDLDITEEEVRFQINLNTSSNNRNAKITEVVLRGEEVASERTFLDRQIGLAVTLFILIVGLYGALFGAR